MSSDKSKEPILQGPSGRPDDAPRMGASPQGQGTKRHRDMRSLSPLCSSSQPAEQQSNPFPSQPAAQHPNPFSSQPAEQQSIFPAGNQTNPAASRSINNSTAESAKQVPQYTGIPADTIRVRGKVSESVKPTKPHVLPTSDRSTATMGLTASSKVAQDESPDRTDQDPLRDPHHTEEDPASSDENPAPSDENPAPSDGKPVLSAAARARKQKKRGGKKAKKAKAKKAALAATMGSEDASESNTAVSVNPKSGIEDASESNTMVSGNSKLGSDAENASNSTMPCLTVSDAADPGIKEDTTHLSELGREIVVGEILKFTLDLFDEISKGTPVSNMTKDQRQEFETFAGMLFDKAERETSDATPNEHHEHIITDFVHMMHDKISKETAASFPTEEVEETEEEHAKLFLRLVGDLEKDYTPKQLCAMLVKLQTKYDELETKNDKLQKKNDEILEGINKKTSELAKVARDQRIKIDKLLKDLKNERRVKGTVNKIANENTELTCRNSELEGQMHVLKGTLAGALHEQDALRVKLGIKPEALKEDMKNASEAISDMLKNQVHPSSTGITKTMDEMENNLAKLRSIVDSAKATSTAPPADHSKLPPEGKLNADGMYF